MVVQVSIRLRLQLTELLLILALILHFALPNVTLDPVPGFNTYYWSTTETTESINVTTSNNYSVTVTGSSGCPGVDTIAVNFVPIPVVNLGPDVTLCAGICDTLDAGTQPVGNTFLWDDGSTNQTRIVCSQSNYWVTVYNAGGCSTSDTINVNYYTPPLVNIGPDTTICAGNGSFLMPVLDSILITGVTPLLLNPFL